MDNKNTQLILAAINEIKVKVDSHDEQFEKINAKLASHDEHFDRIDEQYSSLSNCVTRMEKEHGDKIQILLERTSLLVEQHNEMIQALNHTNSKVNEHDVRIEILEEKVL